ncbi:indole-diterpene biosynthesis protein PaxU [Drepanopeziza brunnea f. sp. 'multigermtubi' MB_m1]|uniref:Indole-diterpene biosynthesis protein PaxU n=2 Tax=Drepanopeziza brunnea f. sp. 'multigermtubi' TaxID=698441 RepID=K1WT21_MARBU|nr:indole-diterpene biosynthesis protein PaxU [Drepanopeziza brunnea f. sp. 'multigermtubi' MB_m1]EKD20795.1 indole-diterpene biosynthesis protein PaxU [Drepanopeziza brunnea f. sp. 'multigermtubi' MB_m1]
MATSARTSSGLEHFTRVNESMWINKPTSTPTSTYPSPSSAPDLILLAGWMGASPRLLSKYTAGYEKLYPSARILAITTTACDAVFQSQSSNVARIEPAIDTLLSLPPEAKLLVHCFSNGGAWRTCTIAKAYREKMGRSLPVTAMVLDSTPGRERYETTIRAFSVSLPKNIILNTLAAVLLRIGYGVLRIAAWLSGKTDFIAELREDLNNKDLFDVDSSRLYVYSDTDLMVDWRFVEEHIAEAKSLGYAVQGDRFIGSAHCGHLLQDSERYWGGVTSSWETAL